MKQKQLAGLFSFIMLLPAWTAAAPSLQGSTGNIVVPSADVLRLGQFDLGYYHETGEKTAVAAVGISRNWELSAARREREHGTDYTAVNLKYAVAQESITEPGLAIGVEDISAEGDRSLYVVASKGLPFGIRLHAGCGNGSYGGLFYAVERKSRRMRRAAYSLMLQCLWKTTAMKQTMESEFRFRKALRRQRDGTMGRNL